MRPGFDSEKYLEEQSHAILERAAKFGDKLPKALAEELAGLEERLKD